jgi:GMP synthase-like glutamine amidotransferase
MGGPMSVGDESEYAWLTAEKHFIKEAIAENKTVLGICLGSQLIANVLGAKVYPNKKKEIGWFPVSLTEEGKSNRITKDLPPEMIVLHWHGDTFELPEGAIHLIKTDVCSNQAFVYNNKVVGLQFHFEATPDSLQTMINNCRAELVADDFIQTEQEILANIDLCATTNKYLSTILNNLVRNHPI